MTNTRDLSVTAVVSTTISVWPAIMVAVPIESLDLPSCVVLPVFMLNLK